MMSAAILGFVLAQLGMMLDMMMDYDHYLWKVRFGIIWRGSSYSMKRKLAEAKYKADRYGNKIEAMDSAYWESVSENWNLKRWVCTKCMVIFLSVLVIVPFSIFNLVYNGDFYSFFVSISVLYFFLNIKND